jgi:hypothetical protein
MQMLPLSHAVPTPCLITVTKKGERGKHHDGIVRLLGAHEVSTRKKKPIEKESGQSAQGISSAVLRI